jgi:hypothetical protein
MQHVASTGLHYVSHALNGLKSATILN